MSTPPVPYSGAAINARLQGTVNAIDAGSGNGSLILRAGATPLASFQMIKPCGTVANQVLTFSGTLATPAASATGNAGNAIIVDSNGAVMVPGLVVATSASNPSADIFITNGLGTTRITVGQAIQVNPPATITGA